MSFPGTVFCDIDGVLIFHHQDMTKQHLAPAQLLPGALEQLKGWEMMGYRIILTTGRKESTRAATEKQLSEVGIFYDQLVMGLNRGPRIIVNDLKPNSIDPTAIAVNLERNVGFL